MADTAEPTLHPEGTLVPDASVSSERDPFTESVAERTARDLADLRELGHRFTELASVDAASLTRRDHAELLIRMATLHDQCTRITGSIADVSDTIAAPCAVGEKSVKTLLRAKSRIERNQTGRFLTAGRCRYRFPTFDAAHRAARVTTGHIEIMAGLAKRAHSVQLTAAEPFLCAIAVTTTVEEFAAACAEWEAIADPTEHFEQYLKAQARRHLWFGNDLFGSLHFAGTADPKQGETFLAVLKKKTDELFRADQAEAAATGQSVTRDNAQRRLDALMELLGLGHGAGAGGRKPEPVLHLLCTCNHTTNHQLDCTHNPDASNSNSNSDGEPGGGGRFGDGDGGDRNPGPTPAESAAAEASMPSATNIYPQTLGGRLIPHRVVTDLFATDGTVKIIKIRPDGTFIDDSVGGRHFTPKQKLLLDLRDRHCQHPGCSTQARYCDHDHIVPAGRGGPTIIANGQLLCRFHHKWKHRNDPKPGRNQRTTSDPSRAP